MPGRLAKSLILLLFPMLFCSCSSLTNINVDVLRPASFSVPPQILSVLVVDNSLPYRDNNVHIVSSLDKVIVIDTLWVDNFGDITIKSFGESLKERKFFDSVFTHNKPLKQDYRNPNFGEIPRFIIDSLINAYNVQAIISLESLKYKTKTNIFNLGDYYYTSLDANGFIIWKMYHPNGNVMDASIQKDSVYWENTGISFKLSYSGLPSIRESVEILAWHLGKNGIKRIAPYWESVTRNIYTGGNHLFLRADDLRLANNWEEAAKVWYYIYENGNRRQKARAAHNLALSYEIRGNFPEAVAWSDISRKIFDGLGFVFTAFDEQELSRNYYLRLCERYQEKKKLDEQLGPGQK